MKRTFKQSETIAPQQLTLLPTFESDCPVDPLLSIEPVEGSFLPGQRYFVAIRHGVVYRAIPIQWRAEESDRVYSVLKNSTLNLSLDQETGNLLDLRAKQELPLILRSLIEGEFSLERSLAPP